MKSAIIGCGGIAQVHAKVLSELQCTELAACADIKTERAQKMAVEYGCKAYGSMEELLENEEIDVIHLCTPHYLHTPMAKAAAEKGIAVFTEKPPAITEEQWEDFCAVSQKVPVGICFQNRYNKSVRYIQKLLDSGAAGKILGARAFVTWKRDERYYTESGWRGSLATEGGGVLMNQSIHTLDLLLQFMGRPESVEACCANRHLKGIIEVEDTMDAYLKFPEASANFFACTSYSADSPVLLELNCENMTVRMEEQNVRVSHCDGTKESLIFTETEGIGKAYWGNGHYVCIKDYYESIAAGKEPPINAKNVGPTVKTMLAMYKSARETHREEKI